MENKKSEKNKYFEGLGRRKTSVARVRIWQKSNSAEIKVNEKDYREYFPVLEYQKILLAPLSLVGLNNYLITIKVKGGGKKGQVEASRLGISRALLKINPDYRSLLKKAGFLTRDARVVERKKFGLRKARRARQWRKR
ncbi:30S ribosomal protein S9 [bacterium]|nr:30S ribosomal protein S9 [bacterium]